MAARVDVALEAPWLSLRVQTPRAADQDETTFALPWTRSRPRHSRLTGPGVCGPAGRPVAGWTVGTALLAPVVLTGGWLVAGALQSGSYSPMRQTMSVLAGDSGTDRWVMTAALLLVGSCQIATGAGLTRVGRPARILLIVTGVSTFGIAASPEPATGPTPPHLAFAVSCAVTTAVWPVLVARRTPGRPWILTVYGCGLVTVVFAGLSCWLLIAAQDGGGNLGLLERLTSGFQGLFPLAVALAVRRAERMQTTRDERGRLPLQAVAGSPQDGSWRHGLNQQPDQGGRRTSPVTPWPMRPGPGNRAALSGQA